MGIFDSLHIGTSGLNAAQLQISVTGHNISNVNDPYYTRQRVVQSAATPLNTIPGDIGMGVKLDVVTRIHNEFTFSKLKNSYSNMMDTQYKSQVLQELTEYFPTLADIGNEYSQVDIFSAIEDYFAAWNDFASNTDEAAQKSNLITVAGTLTSKLNSADLNLTKLIDSVNAQIITQIEEINTIGQQIADINYEITRSEANGWSISNDLRDKRDELELTLSKIANITTYKEDLITSSTFDDATITDRGTKYNLSINGVTIIEGANFHKLTFDAGESQNSYGSIYYQINADSRFYMSDKITGGKLGAMLDLRGRNVNEEGQLTDGILTKYKDMLDTFSNTLAIQTNNIYSQAPQNTMTSDWLRYAQDNTTLQAQDPNINTGNFKVNVYNKKGELVAQKTIEVNPSTTFNDTKQGNSIVDDFNANTDDNKDNNLNNDVNDFFEAVYKYDGKTRAGQLQFVPKYAEGDYLIAIEDNGTNIAGALGLSKFFNGNSAGNIEVADELREDTSLLKGGKTPVIGDNSMANMMINLQNLEFNFISSFSGTQNATISGYYRSITTDMASLTQSVNTLHDTNISLNTAIYEFFQSESGVNVDEELTNLIQFQASYGAAARIITTVDEMIDTLLNLKR